MMKSMLKSGLRMIGYQITRHVDPADQVSPLLRGLQHLCQTAANATIFDVGAHHGQTEKLLRRILPTATIHCFEPFVESFDILKQNISSGSHAHNFGFAEAAGQRVFQANKADVTNSLLPLEASAAETWGLSELRSGGQVECSFETIDQFLNANAIGHIDLLKIDTQGAEYLVLDGAKNALHSQSVRNVFLEIITAPTYAGQKDFSYYVDFFEDAGFKLYGLYDHCYNARGELLQLDALFTLN